MAGRYTLEHWEIALIKTMLNERRYTKQHILSYFTRPGRDLNHTVITAIETGWFGSNISPASQRDRDDFVNWRRALDPYHFAWRGSRQPGFDAYAFEYTFHPVGQGLFTSGWFSRAKQRPFHWVYDCGTANSGTLLSTAMANLQTDVGPGRKLDLVAISHFDKDHVNGLLDLLKVFRVGILLLPYLTPWQRMRIALAENAGFGSPLFDFLAAPTATALATADDADTGIDRILLVPPGEGPVPPVEIPGGAPDRGSSPDDGPLPEPVFKGKEPPGEPDDHDDKSDGGADEAAAGGDPGLRDPRVTMLAPQTAITVGHYWEFVPYNDANLAPADPPAFRAAAAPWMRSLRTTRDPIVAKKCLDELKTLFSRTFGDDSEARNGISLFLYSGPLGDPSLMWATERCDSTDRAPWSYGQGPFAIRPDRFGQLFTGDGYLNDRPRLDAFLLHFGAARIERGGCFQVMHHGSKKNWFAGVAAAVNPAISLFSSDPTRGRLTRRRTKTRGAPPRPAWCHPDPVVWADFASRHPRQIDKTSGWSLSGFFLIP